jgi:uncharacterized phage protein (TIGR01671 family)
VKREIKFRAWNEDTKIMVDLQAITPLALNDSMNTQMAIQGMSGLFLPFKEGMLLMQFTGLLDKNGKEIYEGDILQVPHDTYRMGREVFWQGKEDGFELVVWDEKFSGFGSKDLHFLKEGYSIDELPTRYLWVMETPKKSKVIGNIHENPELLTERSNNEEDL